MLLQCFFFFLMLHVIFIFPTASPSLFSICCWLPYFLPTIYYLLSIFSVGHSPTSLQYMPFPLLSFLPPSSTSPSFPPQCWPPPTSLSPVSNTVYRQLQSHLSVQFIFPCSLWGRAREKTTSCLPKETGGSQGH